MVAHNCIYRRIDLRPDLLHGKILLLAVYKVPSDQDDRGVEAVDNSYRFIYEFEISFLEVRIGYKDYRFRCTVDIQHRYLDMVRFP